MRSAIAGGFQNQRKFSLGTRDPSVARIRNLEAILEVERSWAAHEVANEGGEAIRSLCKGAERAALVGWPPIAAAPGMPAPSSPRRELPKLRSIFESYAAVAEFVENIGAGKFAPFVPETLARAQWARQNADIVAGIPAMAAAG